ncbi:MAG: lipopolysaccharide biosynthesis protein [Phycisphaerae bacterium]|nr:lipopolysaccharide biosynthesis protein [Tepidisphaeraceae bacterium]
MSTTRIRPGSEPREAAPDRAPPVARGPGELACPVEARRVRGVRLWRAVVTSVLAKSLTLVIPIVCLPLFVRYLGAEGYGVYETVGSLAVWLTLSNVGLYLGLQNRLQACFAAGDLELARRYVSSVAVFVTVVSVLGVAVVTALAVTVDWQRVLPTSAPGAGGPIGAAFWVAGVGALMTVALGIPAVVYAASQQLDVANVWEMVGRVLTILASVAVVWTRFGLVGVMVASAAVPLVARAVNLAWMFGAEKPELRPSLRHFDRALLKSAIVDGVYVFVLQTAVMAIYSADKLIVGLALSPEAVTPFAIVGRLFLIGYGAYYMLLMPLWPAYADALRRDDVGWVRRAVRTSLGIGCGGIAVCGGLLLACKRWLIPLWAGIPGETVSDSLIVAVTATFVLRAWVDARSTALNAAGAFKQQIPLFVVHAALNLGLALVMVKPYGVEGVAWATPISAVLTTAWGYPMLMRRYVYGHDRTIEPVTAA